MSENTKIEWCDATVNHWAGCTAVSPACDNCYAKRMAGRLWGTQWGPGQPRHQFVGADETLRALNRKAKRQGRPLRVFHNSLSDFFDNEVPVQWRISAMRSIVETPNLIHILLTKRIGNAAEMLDVAFRAVHGQREKWADNVPSNVWIGATIVNQAEADRDIPKLLAVPARVRFLSMEPLLGQVDLRLPTRTWTNSRGCATCDHCCNGDRCDDPTHFSRGRLDWAPHCRCPYCRGTGKGMPIDWIIVGGESGPGARPMHPDWARSLRDQCDAADVPFLFKQWGEWADMGAAGLGASGPVTNRAGDVKDWMRQAVTFTDGDKATVQAHSWTAHATDLMYRVGKKAAGRLLDGRTWDEVPT